MAIPLTNIYGLYEAQQETGLTDGTAIATIDDKSGNNRALTQSTSSSRAIYTANAINSRPAFTFDGGQQMFWNEGFNTNYSQFTISVVVSSGTAESASRVWPFVVSSHTQGTIRIFGITEGHTAGEWSTFVRTGNGNDSFIPTSGADTTAWTVLTLMSDGSTVSLYRDGTLVGSAVNSGGSLDFGYITMGAYIDQAFSGQIALAGAWTKALTQTERAELHSYVQDEYNILVSDYIAAAEPDIIKTASDSTTISLTESGSYEVVPNNPYADLKGQTYIAYGDSSGTVRTYAPGGLYWELFAADAETQAPVNRHVGGDTAQDTAARAMGSSRTWTIGTTGVVTFVTGGNDVGRYHDSEAGKRGYVNGIETFLALLRADYREEDGHAVTGTWTVNSGAAFASAGRYSTCTTPGTSVTVNFTGTDFTFVLLGSTDGTSGSAFNIEVDGVLHGTGTTINQGIPSINNPWPWVHVPYHVRDLAYGDHTVKITHAGTSGQVLAVDCGLRWGTNPPKVALFPPPILTAGGYDAYPSPYATEADTLEFKQLLRDSVAKFPDDGSIVIADDSGWDAATMTGGDDLHPNDIGHRYIADTMLAAASGQQTVEPTTVQISASDTATFSTTESVQFAIVSVSASDASTLSTSETIEFAPVSIASNDSITLSVLESSSFAHVEVNAQDSSTISINESASIFTDRPGADEASVSLVESSEIVVSGTVEISATDQIDLSAETATQFAPVEIIATDDATLSATENIDFGTTEITTADELSISITEQTEFSIVNVVASDSISINITESSSTFVDRPGADNATLSITESSELLASGVSSVASNDAAGLTIQETAEIKIALTAADDINVFLAESIAFSTVNVNSNDDINLNLTESVSFGTITVSALDSLDLLLVESTTIFDNRIGADNASISAVESSSIVKTGIVTILAADTATISAEESGQLAAEIAVDDTLFLQTIEQTEFGAVNVSSDDTHALSIEEALTMFKTIASSDTANLSITEDHAFGLIQVGSTDSLVIQLLEAAEHQQPTTVYKQTTDSITIGIIDEADKVNRTNFNNIRFDDRSNYVTIIGGRLKNTEGSIRFDQR